MEKYSVPVPHTDMIGFQNIIDGWLAQSGLVWVFIITVGCAGMSNWLGELMFPMASKKTAQEPTGPKRYTDDQLRRAIDETKRLMARSKGVAEDSLELGLCLIGTVKDTEQADVVSGWRWVTPKR